MEGGASMLPAVDTSKEDNIEDHLHPTPWRLGTRQPDWDELTGTNRPFVQVRASGLCSALQARL